MKTPVPPPYRLDELRERVIASLANADDERHLFVLRALAGGLDDPGDAGSPSNERGRTGFVSSGRRTRIDCSTFTVRVGAA